MLTYTIYIAGLFLFSYLLASSPYDKEAEKFLGLSQLRWRAIITLTWPVSVPLIALFYCGYILIYDKKPK